MYKGYSITKISTGKYSISTQFKFNSGFTSVTACKEFIDLCFNGDE